MNEKKTKIIDMPNPAVEEQFAKGPAKEEAPMTREQIEVIIDEELPYMRKREEHNRLQIAMIEQDVLLGRIAPNQVPGLLGMRLMVEETQSFSYLASWKASQEHAMKEQQSKEDKEKASTAGEA